MRILFFICIIGIVGLVAYLSTYIHALLDRRGFFSHWWFFGDISTALKSLLTGSELDGERRHGRLVLEPETAEESHRRVHREWTRIAIVIALIALLCLIIWMMPK